MSERLKQNLDTLKTILKVSPDKRYQILRKAGTELIKCVCECAINILSATIPLTAIQKKLLEKHKNFLRFLADKKRLIHNKKKRLLRQSSRFFLYLIRPVITAILNKVITL